MTLFAAAMTLILVMDPLGNVPVFLSILKRYDHLTQSKIIIRETSIAFLILVVFLFFGRYIIQWLHITTAALSIAGGIVLFLIALRMIFPPEDSGEKEREVEEPFIVPLAVPLVAGPSAIATVLLFVTQESQKIGQWFLAILIASLFSLVVLLSSRYLMRFLGHRGLVATERLMGMILTAVAVQMLLSGIEHYFVHTVS